MSAQQVPVHLRSARTWATTWTRAPLLSPRLVVFLQTRPGRWATACLRPAAAWKTVQAGRRVLSRRVPLNSRCVARDAAGDTLNRQLAHFTAQANLPLDSGQGAGGRAVPRRTEDRSTGHLGGTYANASPSPPAPSGREFSATLRGCHPCGLTPDGWAALKSLGPARRLCPGWVGRA